MAEVELLLELHLEETWGVVERTAPATALHDAALDFRKLRDAIV